MTARLSRRGLLTLAAFATLPAGCSDGSGGDPIGEGTEDTLPQPPVNPSVSAIPSPVARGGGAVKFKTGKVQLGAYVSLKGRTSREALTLRRRQLGRTERIVHRFYSWTDKLPGSLSTVPASSVQMLSWRGPRYTDITGGKSDRPIAAAAAGLAEAGKPVLLRWGWDMNRDFYRWGGGANDRNAAGYVASWKRLRRIFAEEGADNVSWVWSPNWKSSPDQAWNAMAKYYPGDDQVDWAGVSGYAEAQSPGEMFEVFYETYAGRKPIMLSEVAVVDRGGRSKADWIDGFAAWVKTRPAIGAVVWFDTDNHPGSTEKWRIDSDARSLAAYRAMAGDPAFGG